jgi:hypothetical protein
MNACQAFFDEMHARFPMLSEKADKLYEIYWGEPPAEADDFFCWFESVANALNSEMRRGTPEKQYTAVFAFILEALNTGSAEVKRRIDVSFVENLFWRVAPARALPYWKALPPALKALYIDFHKQIPGER